jgi:twitching motility protein PilT
MDIFDFVAQAKAKSASDLHLTAYSQPLVRVNGLLRPLNGFEPLTTKDIRDAVEQIASPSQMQSFDNTHELDFGYKMKDGTSLRCNVAQQRGTLSLAVRILPPRLPDIDELELPEICKKLVSLRRGLVVISGPTGSGKTTTQAAMVNYINNNQMRYVVTIEDPIEYFHPNVNSVVIQRELGGDTYSFAQALKHVLRHDPDVILVGEMRDEETVNAVLSLAETGHLIFTTSHAPRVTQTVERIIDLFKPEERPLAQSRIASLLTAVLCQTLVPRADGTGRVAAVETMMVNNAVANAIRESKFNYLNNIMRSNAEEGMISLDRVLTNLYLDGVISGETVFSYCHEVDEVKKILYEYSNPADRKERRIKNKTPQQQAPMM